MWPCPNINSCLGADQSSTGDCEVGYKGNKCQSCELGYSRVAINTCGKCPSKAGNIAKLIAIFIVVILVCVMMIKSALNSAYRPKAMHAVYLKILVNYLQLVMMTAAFELDWPNYVKELFLVQESAGSVSDQIFSIDCFLEDETDSTDAIFFNKVLFMSLLPVIVTVPALIFWGMMSCTKITLNYMKEEFVCTLIVLIFLVQPNIIKVMFKAVNCIEIDSGEYWLVEDLDIKCWDDKHSMYAFNIALPSIFLWGILIPGVIVFLLFKNRKKLHSLRVRKIYGFLFNGYSKREYYWEIVILYRKIVILCSSVILGNISTQVQALTVMIVLLMCIYLQSKYTPFTQISLNQCELRAILVGAITIYSGLFYLTNDLDEGSKVFFFVVIVVVNIYFIIYWIRSFCGVGLQGVFAKIPFLRRLCIKKTRDGFEDNMFRLEEKVPHVLGQGVDKLYRLHTDLANESKLSTPNGGEIREMRDLFLEVINKEVFEIERL